MKSGINAALTVASSWKVGKMPGIKLKCGFSNTKKPCKGHCETLFQITDHRVLQRWMGKKVDTGVIYHYDELDTEWKDNDLELGNAKAEAAYKFGGKHTPLTHLLRGILWRKRFWCTEKLNQWLDEFKPECVFLAFSDDYFIPQIAMYAAKRYNVPTGHFSAGQSCR